MSQYQRWSQEVYERELEEEAMFEEFKQLEEYAKKHPKQNQTQSEAAFTINLIIAGFIVVVIAAVLIFMK